MNAIEQRVLRENREHIEAAQSVDGVMKRLCYNHAAVNAIRLAASMEEEEHSQVFYSLEP